MTPAYRGLDDAARLQLPDRTIDLTHDDVLRLAVGVNVLHINGITIAPDRTGQILIIRGEGQIHAIMITALLEVLAGRARETAIVACTEEDLP